MIATTEPVAPAEAVLADPLEHLAHAVRYLAQRLPELREACTDPEATDMAELLAQIQAARTELVALERETEAALVRAMTSDMVCTPRLRVERKRSRDRTAWDHDGWRHDARQQVLRKAGLLGAQVLTKDGELLDKGALHAVLAQVQQVQGSGPPKVTALRSLGLDPMDYCETSPGRTTVQVTVLADETEQEGNA